MMKKNWFLEMEKITIFMGAAILSLGISNLTGTSKISTALVTGISLAGLSLTLSDLINKQIEHKNNPVLNRGAQIIGGLLYYIAALSIIALPNSNFITSMQKETLDSFSTSASVIALGLVFMMIGDNNRRSVVNEQKRKINEIELLQEMAQDTWEERLEIINKLTDIIEEQEKTIKDLERTVKQSTKEKIEV
ncbi:hypothetical protein P4V74_15095 [Bacillus thuringiensis]|uniref:hypothetical protein n=1 Tax=Bacillus cereus TaxID=1396 RepID=UPI0010BDA591|nr:hypothetical protein [Bacillus cereus]MED2032581.1 hypothetical protein [Bacillus thuringiensis]TKI32663.1 hypothetical protein FC683_15855 [Bacillus cereus]